MMKREANGFAESSRSKRPRRDREAMAQYSSDEPDAADNGVSEGEGGGGSGASMSQSEVRRHGMHIWQTVVNAVSKDGRPMSAIFMDKPPKKLYPDYYILIQHPIALNDIKGKIDRGVYKTLDDVRKDFELMFNNAKQYNMPESFVWKDAKDLLKLVNKTYAKIVPPPEGQEKKSKPPSLNKMLKSRLTKVIDKTDEYGRYLSAEFMELPSKKLWPIYYTMIKQPQCFNNVLKKLKDKQYSGAAEFADDVELIFSNAMQFNQENTQIWFDAVTMRNMFRQLMSDLPPPHSLPQYQSTGPKIKIKPQAAKAEPAHPSLTLRVPATSSATKAAPAATSATPVPPQVTHRVTQPPSAAAPAPQPAPAHLPAAASPAPASKPKPSPPVPQPAVAPSALAHSANLQLPSTANIKAHVRAPAAAPAPAPAPVPAPAPAPAPAPSPAPAVHQVAPTPSSQHAMRPPSVQNTMPPPVVVPTPPPPPPAPPVSQHQLKSVKLQVQPRGRVIYLHHTDGVKAWALRMSPGETRIIISDVLFLNAHDDDSEQSSEEEEEDEEDEYDEGAENTPSRNGKKKGKATGRRRGRPTRASTRQATNAKAQKKLSKPGEVQVKVNGLVIRPQAENDGEWDVHLPLGPNTVEIGEVGGLIWKVYAERVGAPGAV